MGNECKCYCQTCTMDGWCGICGCSCRMIGGLWYNGLGDVKIRGEIKGTVTSIAKPIFIVMTRSYEGDEPYTTKDVLLCDLNVAECMGEHCAEHFVQVLNMRDRLHLATDKHECGGAYGDCSCFLTECEHVIIEGEYL